MLRFATRAGFVAGLLLILGAKTVGATPAVKSATTPQGGRAELMYDTYCIGCHTSLAHQRGNHQARSSAEVAEYVQRWSSEQQLGWNEEDILEVTDFLVRRYYHFSTANIRSNDAPH